MSRPVSKTPLRIAITTGEPAGVGPEVCAQALAQALSLPVTPTGMGTHASGTGAAIAQRAPASADVGLPTRWPGAHIVLIGDAQLLAERAALVGVDWRAVLARGDVSVEHRPLAVRSHVGRLDAANGRYVLDLLDAAIDGAMNGTYAALVTAPLQKSTINDAGIPFTGHTEYLADRTNTPRVVMMLAGTGERPLRVALATTHLPLRDVASALTFDSLVETLTIIDRDLRRSFGRASPRILVTGLNPHAGENGYLGREEIDVITPAIERVRAAGIDARGPYAADTLFQPRHLRDADCVLAMFHDQGLPVLKYATFGEGINVTLGLPIVRTSVDHGTALDLAGTGEADCGSLLAAIDTAVTMARYRNRGDVPHSAHPGETHPT